MKNVLEKKPMSLPDLLDSMDLYQIERVDGSINYGRQLQLQFKRLTKKRFSVTKIPGVCDRESFNIRRIA